MWAAQRLLTQLQVWLQARHRGVLALELEWTLDLRRLNGVRLPSHEQLTVRTAQPTQDIAHLRRLVAEQLSRATLSAPANHLRLRSLETMPWGGASKSLLPEDNVKGERLHQLVERLSVRLGEGNVVVPQARADHRPESMQRWVPARTVMPDSQTYGLRVKPAMTSVRGLAPQERLSCQTRSGIQRSMPTLLDCGSKSAMTNACDAIYPPWLLPQPVRLEVRGEKPQYHGPLRLLAGPQRLETGWWDDGAKGLALRDYFIARSDEAGLLWVYRERLQPDAVRWYLQGIYA
jgi:protein ImuB